MNKILTTIIVFCFTMNLFSQNATSPSVSNENNSSGETIRLENLLAAYLENDLSLQELAIQKQKAELSKQSTEISNGFDITLSTGTMSLRMSNNGTSFSVRPSVEASLPQYKNLSLKAGTNISVSGGSSEKSTSTASPSGGASTSVSSSSGNGTTISDTSLSVGVDIISEKELNRKITLMKAERNVTEADWKLSNTALTAEKNFYNELKSLFSKAQNILSEKSNLYSDTISFEETKARGYAESSSTYRLAQMKVLSTQHSVETKIREFNHDLAVFYTKCGITNYTESSDNSKNSETDDSLENFIKTFSSRIPSVEPISITDFEKENYTEIESAKWNYQINSLSRSAKKDFTLGASAGYTFGNTTIGGNQSSTGKTRVDTADVGVSSTIGGVKLTGGVSVPVTGDSHAPSFTASVTFTPNTFKQNKITKENNELTEQQELIAIAQAESKYETTVVDKTKSLQDIEWQKSTNDSSLQMYKEIEADMKKYFDSGFIKESEYLSAKTNVELYTIKQIINELDLIIYNNEIKLLFR